MTFEALTMFNAIGVNTSFLIIENPTVSGTSPTPLVAGNQIKVVFNNDSTTKISILSIADTSAVFVCEDGTQWEMTPPTGSDLPTFVRADWAHRQKWIVRSKLL